MCEKYFLLDEELTCDGIITMRTTTSWFVMPHLKYLRAVSASILASEGRVFWHTFFAVITLTLSGMDPLRAQEGVGSAGAFMRLGIGARAGSLGDAYVAAATGPEAIYWNPAALAVDP